MKETNETFELTDLRGHPFVTLSHRFIDDHLDLEPRSWKLLIYLMRISVGVDRSVQKVSLRQMTAATGLGQRALVAALSELERRGLIQESLQTDGAGTTAGRGTAVSR